MSLLDQAGDVRPGETLDVTPVDRWIREQVPGLEGALELRQFPGGASNLTYLARYANGEFILRRPPFGTKAKSAHDMAREYRILSTLKPLFPKVPGMVALCSDPSVMGCDFYLMERIVGIIPRGNLPEGMTLDAGQAAAMCRATLDTLIELHSIRHDGTPLESLGKGDGYVARQIEGWSARFRAARTPNVPDAENIMAWLAAHMPPQTRTCVIHNDFRMDNLVFDPARPDQVIGVLDWEMATLGDPLMDLGNSLAYWVQADDPEWMQQMRRQPTHLPGMMTRDEVFGYYCERMQISASHTHFYRIYGIFRLAVILQQIYFRFHQGQTQDRRFAHFDRCVHSLAQQCESLMAEV